MNNLRLIKLKKLKTFIMTNLANGFIYFFKYFINTSIFFI